MYFTKGSNVGIGTIVVNGYTKGESTYEAYATNAYYAVTIAPTTNGTVSADVTTAPAGATVTLTVTPNQGFVLGALSVADANEQPVIVTDNKFTMPAAVVTVSATFYKDPTALDNTEAGVKAVKVLRNGQLIILRDGKEYNVMGTLVK